MIMSKDSVVLRVMMSSSGEQPARVARRAAAAFLRSD
jgi:hypothetical protein